MFSAWVQEGELRPQLLDRFGMSVNVTTLLDVDVRTQMVLDKMAYEQVRLPHTPACHFLDMLCCWHCRVYPGYFALQHDLQLFAQGSDRFDPVSRSWQQVITA